MSGIPYQSKLLPYKDFIKEARKKGVSYRKITELLKEKFGLECYPNAVFSFVKARANRKPVFTLPEDSKKESPKLSEIEEIVETAQNQKPLTEPLFAGDKEDSDGEDDLWAAVRERARTDHSKKLVIRRSKTQESSNE